MSIFKSLKIIVLVFALSFGAILTIPTFAANNTANCADLPESVQASAGCTNTGSDDGGITTVIIGILNGIITASGILAVIFVIIGGINYMTSAGDASKVEKAKKTILYAAIGIAICILAFAIVNFVIKNIIG